MITLLKDNKYLSNKGVWLEGLGIDCHLGSLADALLIQLEHPESLFIDWTYDPFIGPTYNVAPVTLVAASVMQAILDHQFDTGWGQPTKYSKEQIQAFQTWLKDGVTPILEYKV